MLTTKITRAIGGNSDLLTSQSFVFQGSTIESEQVMLIVLISGSGEDVFTKVRNISLSCEQHFFSADTTITQRLQDTIQFLQDQTVTLTESNIMLAALKDEVLYVISRGLDEVLLFRDQKTSHLVRPQENQLISGYLQPEDRVLFMSARFAPDLIASSHEQPIGENDQDISDITLEENRENEISSNPPQTWEDYFQKRLLLSDQEIIEEEIENYLASLSHPEPIAVVLLSTQTQEYKEEPLLIREIPDQQPYLPIDEPTTNLKEHLRHYETSTNPIAKKQLSIPKIPWIKIRRSIYRLIFPLSFKKIGIVAAVLLLIGMVLSFQAYQYGKNKLTSQQFSQALIETKKNLDLAQTNKESNPQMAKQYLASAKQSFDEASKLRKNDTQLPELNNQLNAAQQAIYRSTPLNDWQPFLSLDLIKPNFSADRMSISLNRILLLDKAQKSLVYVDTETKNNQLIAGETQIGSAKYATINGDFIFSYSDDKGVIRNDLNTKKPLTVSTPDKEWGRITDIFSFSSNLYLLDAGHNQIWKYVPTQNSYSEKQIYLKDNQGLDFSNAKQLFIDFSVWVVKDNAEIYRFTAGNKDFFSIGGLDQPIAQVQSLFAPEEDDKVFLLDPQNQRIVVTKKSGEFLLQYTSDKFGDASDIIYEEKSHILYLLEGGKIWQTTLP